MEGLHLESHAPVVAFAGTSLELAISPHFLLERGQQIRIFPIAAKQVGISLIDFGEQSIAFLQLGFPGLQRSGETRAATS